MVTRTEQRRRRAVLEDWLIENEFESVDSFLDSYFLIRVTNPSMLDGLLDRFRASRKQTNAK